MGFQINHGLGNCLQIVRRPFLLSVSRPVPAFLFSQVHIVPEQNGKVGRSVLLFGFQLCKDFFSCFQNVGNPATQAADGASDRCYHPVGGFNVTVQVADIGFNPSTLHLRDSGSHVDGRKDVKPLPFIRAEIHTLRASHHFKIAVLHHLPAMPPFLPMVLLIPVNGIFLMAFPAAGWEPDPLPVLVEVINLAALGKPFPMFVHRPHSQHDMTVGVVSGRVWVMDRKVTAHPLGNKMLHAVFLNHLRIMLQRHFSWKCKNKASGKLGVPLFFHFLSRVP